MSSRRDNEALELDPLELRKIITLERVTELTTLSEDSLKRHHADKNPPPRPAQVGHAARGRARHRHTYIGDLKTRRREVVPVNA